MRFLTFASSAFALALIMQACRSKDDDEGPATRTQQVEPLVKAPLSKDQGQGLTSLLSSQASSPVQWQHWHKDLLKHAASEKKTLLAMVASGTDPHALEVLDIINETPSICSLLNENHLNVLIDSNLHPDLEFLATSICLRSKTPAASPILVWFSYEGNPISWSHVGQGSASDIAELIRRMSHTVHSMWIEDPEYVLRHSGNDFEQQMDLLYPKPITEEEYNPGLVLAAIRNSASLFDPTSNAIDGIGNLNTARYVELLVRASQHPDLPESRRDRYLQVASLIADHLILHGLGDPLDGGVFSGVQYTTPALPKFSKTLRVQALSMRALYGLYQATGDTRYREAADAVMAYTRKNLTLENGGYALGMAYRSEENGNNPCIWKLEQIKAVLTQKEFEVASVAFGLKEAGNIPFVDDPRHLHGNKNSLAWKLPRAELATRTSMDPAALQDVLRSITAKLAKAREEKTPQAFVEQLETSGSTALLAGAYVCAYRATGEASHLEQATGILNHLRSRFIDEEGNLHRAYFKDSLNSHLATGADHAQFCRAALDLHEVTLDPSWLELAYDLHRRMNALLADADNHLLMEYTGTGYPKTYDVEFYTTLHELDNDNTWALAHANAKRLALRLDDEALTSQWNNLESYLLRLILVAPTSCIDFLTYECTAQGKKVYIKTPAAPELLATASKHPCQIIAVGEEGPPPGLDAGAAKVPAGTAVVMAQGEKTGVTTSAAELTALLK